MWLFYTIFGILVIWAGVSIFAIRNLLNQIEQHEDFNNELYLAYLGVYDKIKAIDIRGSFEADDEVGDIYGQIKRIILKLANFTGRLT